MKKRIWMAVAAVALGAMIIGLGETAFAGGGTVAQGAQSGKLSQQSNTTGTTGNESPTPSPTPEPSTKLYIDGTYIEDGMNAAYMFGYSPTVSDGVAHVVLPLTGADSLDPTVYATVTLPGEGPFVVNNYDNIPVGQKFAGTNFYVAHFYLPLKGDRINGTYPVSVSVKYYENLPGGKVDGYATFTVNVRVTDGKSSASESPGVTSQPKVIMSKYTVTPDPIYAGKVFDVSVTLTNTSEKNAVKNLTANYKSQTTDLIPEDGTNTAYIESIDADGSARFTFRMEARADAKPGPQKIDVAIAYEDSKANKYEAAGEVTVQVRQQIRLEHDDPKFQSSVYQGDSVSNTLNLYNKGKNTLYNVTVFLEMPGFVPDSSVFLGNMESGASKSADMYAMVDPMGEGVVGPVEGKYLVTYEDEYGDSYELEIPLKCEIMEFIPEPDPGMDPGMEAEQEGAGVPWWVWVIVAGAGAGIVAGVLAKRKKAKRERELMEEMDDDELS